MIHNVLNYKSLPVYGDGKHVRSGVYVEDHCRVIDLIFKHGKIGEIYNVGSNNEREKKSRHLTKQNWGFQTK